MFLRTVNPGWLGLNTRSFLGTRMANSSISLTSIDFDDLRDSLVTYMRSQDEYRDFDFTTSNLRVIIDLLARNSHLNAFFLNMIMSEGFLDSAQLRSSLISHAKELNYLPRSARSAEAVINLRFTGDRPSYLLRKGQTFASVIKSNTYIFSLSDNQLMTSSNGTFSANLSIYEGVYVSDSYIMNRSDDTQRYLLTNRDIDTASIGVAVYEDGDLTGESYRRANTLLGMNETSKKFFVQQAENEMYEIVFGDGVIGYRPKDGARLVFDYRVTKGAEGNGARVFAINFNPGPTEDAGNINVQTISISSQGAPIESLESIRYNAPRHFRVQERAANADDFEIVLTEQFPEIQAVSTYGGETLDPPRFGKVVVAIAIDGVDGLPESKKDVYEKFLRERMMLTMGVIFAEPLRSYVSVRSKVRYNLNLSTLSPENVKALVKEAIRAWADEELDGFGSKIRYSKFIKLIDDVNASVVGNDTDLLLYKKIRPLLGTYQNMTVEFSTPLRETIQDEDLDEPDRDIKTMYSSDFLVNGSVCRLEDDGGGRVMVVVSQDGRDRYAQQVGTINYHTGQVQLQNFYVDSYDDQHIKLFVRLRDKDVIANPATIVAIESNEIRVEVEAIRE